MYPYLLLLSFCISMAFNGFAQNDVLDKRVTLDIEKVKVKVLLLALEKEANVLFNYKSSILPRGGNHSLKVKDKTLREVLSIFNVRYNLAYKVIGNRSIVLTLSSKKSHFTISGFVEEENSGEKVIGAFIYDRNKKNIVQTNENGFFNIRLPIKDTSVLIFSRVGYEKFRLLITTTQDQRVIIHMVPITMEPTKVQKRHKRWGVMHSGTTTISVKETEDLPSLFGEGDILRSLQLYPGIQSANEGISGLIVRGGTPDQNLVLLDGVPVYQASHLYGLFSIFNSDVIRRVTFTKSNFSVKDASRLSSLVDIRTKDGNKKKLGIEGSTGLVSSKLMIEGPIKKNKSSFLVSARRSYLDIFGNPILSLMDQDIKDFAASYYFYDLNGKVSTRVSKNSNLSFSAYHGVDRTRIKNTYRIKENDLKLKESDVQDLTWENTLFSARYTKYYNKKWFGSLYAVFSNYSISNNSEYKYKFEEGQLERIDEVSYKYKTSISDVMLFGNWEWRPNNKHKLSLGFNSTLHIFNPGVTTFSSHIDDIDKENRTGSGNENGLESRIFIEDDIKISPKLFWKVGVNLSNFYIEEESYNSIQAQTSLRRVINKDWIGHIAVGNNVQFVHYLANSSLGLPTDVWLPTTKDISPEKAYQVAVGAEYQKLKYSFLAELYYKSMTGLLEYKEGANFLGTSSDWESKVVAGNGQAYGAEFKWAKEQGKTRGWVSYTLSWSNRIFDSINDGKVYPFRYDRRHDLSIVVNHQLTKKKSFGLTWVYGSGNPTTIPVARYAAYPGAHPSEDVFVYGKRNNYRMQDYHRLDVVYHYKTKSKFGEGLWTFGLYNAYNRLNPYFITAGVNDQQERTFYQVSILPVLPSISYKFKF